MNRKWDISKGEARKKCVEEVIELVRGLDSTEVGVIAAQDIIDTVTSNLGPEIYNHGVNDSKRLISDKLSDLSTEIDLLQQPT